MDRNHLHQEREMNEEGKEESVVHDAHISAGLPNGGWEWTCTCGVGASTVTRSAAIAQASRHQLEMGSQK
jgi:hypothetical protein